MSAADLPELRDHIRARRAPLAGFMEQGADLELDGDLLRVIPRKDIYIRYLNDNRATIGELASELYGRKLRVDVSSDSAGAEAPQAGEEQPSRNRTRPTNSSPALTAALEYRARCWWPVPIPLRTKAPTIESWPDLRLDGAKLEVAFKHPCNVGVILGEPSGDLVDIDLDCAEALALADCFLPATDAAFGRASKLRSHRLYRAKISQTARFRAPDGSTLVELRSTGGQTVFPPSEHPSSEAIAWEKNGEPAHVDSTELRKATGKLAAASLITRRYPKAGGRHHLVLTLAGALLRSGWSEDEAGRFIEAIARAAGDEEARARLTDIKTTARRLANDGRATGWPTLANLIGEQETTLIREWLGLRAEQAAVEWSEPIPLDNPPLPTLPNDALPPWLNDMVEATAEATETPRELAALMALGTVAAAVQKKFSIVVSEGYSEPLAIWANVALDSGNRKTAVLNRITEPLLQWEREQAQAIRLEAVDAKSRRDTAEVRLNELRKQAARAKSEDFEDLSRQIAQLESELPEVPKAPRLWAQDVTPERLGALMAENGERLALISDEGGIFDILAGRYSNGVPNLDLFLKSHSGSAVRVDRSGRPSVVMGNPALTMVLSVQPDLLSGLASKPEFRGRGLLARFLYALPVSTLGRRRGNAAPVPAHVASLYDRAIWTLLTIPAKDTPVAIELTPAAHRVFFEFAQAVERELVEGGRFEHVHDWAGKLPGAAARVAGLFHCAEYAFSDLGAVKLSDASMKKAVEFAEVLSEHALAVFDLMGADASLKAARKAWSWITRNRKPQFTFRDAHQALRGSFPRADDLGPAFEVLIERAHIREVVAVQHTPGRPSRRYEVNPALADGWDSGDPTQNQFSPNHTQNTQNPPQGRGGRQEPVSSEDFENIEHTGGESKNEKTSAGGVPLSEAGYEGSGPNADATTSDRENF